MNNNDTKTIPWVEKYRPTNLNDIVLDPLNKSIISQIIDTNYFPNILLYGPPGTGKTTTIINMVNKFQEKHNIFITGAGGTGKTKLIQTLVTDAYSRNAKIQVCALTGCAAILLNCGARTIHSWSGIRLGKGPKGPIIQSILRNKRLVKTWRQTQILIIDEVSMMSLKIFELLEETARVVRNNPAPFGGIQVIFTGDFFQLPPVGTYGEPDTE